MAADRERERRSQAAPRPGDSRHVLGTATPTRLLLASNLKNYGLGIRLDESTDSLGSVKLVPGECQVRDAEGTEVDRDPPDSLRRIDENRSAVTSCAIADRLNVLKNACLAIGPGDGDEGLVRWREVGPAHQGSNVPSCRWGRTGSDRALRSGRNL